MKTKNQDLDIGEDFVSVPKEDLDVFFPHIEGQYHAVCLNNGIIGPLCKNNKDSICIMGSFERPRNFYHAWDGKNCWKCPCG